MTAADGSIPIRGSALAARPPFDWPSLHCFLAARAIPGVEQVGPAGYARTFALGGAHGTIAFRPGEARIRFPVGAVRPDITHDFIIGRIRRMFDLDADPAVIGAHLSADPRLAPLVAARPGLRVPGAWDGFELAVRGILGQQITVAAATRLAGRLVAAFGERLACSEGPLTHVFPTPERLADAPIAATIGMPGSRGTAISALAAAAARDPSLLAARPGLDAAVARLRALPGIGDWTAQYIAMRALREPDAFPAADIGLLRAMATAQGRPTPAQLLARAEAWRPWRAYAALHLWMSETEAPAP